MLVPLLCCLWGLFPLRPIAVFPAPTPVRAGQIAAPSSVVKKTPKERLYQGASLGDIPMMQAALHDGADINTRYYKSQDTALMVAAGGRSAEAVAFLLRQRASVNARNESGATALHRVAFEPNGTMEERQTLGYEAAARLAEKRQYEMMQKLLAAGADVNARSDGNVTPLHIMVWRNGDIALDRLQLLAQYKVHLNAQEDDGSTALHIAAAQHTPALLRLLLKLRANPNLKDNAGRTPLMRVDWGYESYQALVEGGANVSVRDPEGRTLLLRLFDSAGQSYGEAHTDNEGELKPERIGLPEAEVIRLLLRHGADVNSRDNNGKTALQWVKQLTAQCKDAENRKQAESYARLLEMAGAKR